jgi:hypothetical protein
MHVAQLECIDIFAKGNALKPVGIDMPQDKYN